MRFIYICWLFIFMLFPSSLKVVILRWMGHSIEDGVKIGFSYLDIKFLCLKNGVKIGSGNVFKGVQNIHMGESASIGRFNLFTCNSYYLKHFPEHAGRLYLSDKAVITMRHYFDLQHSITIGEKSLVAGIQTIFFTHQKGLNQLNEAKPIILGKRVYLGASCKVLPGSVVADHIVVGAGSVVSGLLGEEYTLYASPKAIQVRKLPQDSPYFEEMNPTGSNK